MPVYLNFSQLNLYKFQRLINFHLIWINALAVILILNDVILTTVLRSYAFIWTEILPLVLEGIVLIWSLKAIQKEINALGFQQYYASDQIIYGHIITIGIALSSVAIYSMLHIYSTYFPSIIDNELFHWSLRIVQFIVSISESLIDLMMLYMFVQFSKPQSRRQFDKVCKQKFLMYLKTISPNDKEKIKAVK